MLWRCIRRLPWYDSSVRLISSIWGYMEHSSALFWVFVCYIRFPKTFQVGVSVSEPSNSMFFSLWYFKMGFLRGMNVVKIEEQYSMNTIKGDTIKVKASPRSVWISLQSSKSRFQTRKPHSIPALPFLALFFLQISCCFLFSAVCSVQMYKKSELSWVLHPNQSSAVVYRQQPLQKMGKSQHKDIFEIK